MIDRRMLMNVDWLLLLLVFGIVTWGLVTVYSATHGRLETHLDDFYLKQLYWFCAGLVMMVLVIFVDYQLLSRAAYPLLAIGILLLIAVFLVGRVVSGARRWLVLGPLSFQPSELVKIFLVLSFARYFTETRREGGLRFRDLLIPLVMVVVPFAMIAKQPDLGTALVLFFVASALI